jgi:hypothetical protein
MRTLILVSLAAHLTLPVNTMPDEVNRLDECIQHRFLDRKAFGMQRVAMQVHGLRQFRPENATEQAVVNQLEQKGYQVALYLAGRNVITIPSPGLTLASYRYGVQGPAYITHLGSPQELPPPDSLFEESRIALAAFKTDQGYDIQRGDWTVTLRPLRASNAACLGCHAAAGPPVKIGDPLGVVMYVYKH